MIRRIFLHIAIFSFIALFVYAAIAKLMDFQKFQVQLGQSPMLTRYATVVAWAVPVSELVVAVFIIFERTRLAGLYGAFGLMVMFTVEVFESLLPSLTRNVKLSGPWKFAAGV